MFIRQGCGAFSYPINEYAVLHPQRGLYVNMGLDGRHMSEKHNQLTSLNVY